MSTQIQRRRGTTAEHASFTGALGETTVDTDKDTVVVHDGTTVGGHPLMRENGSNSALALGSAGTPSLKFTGDTNTGIYSPGADQVAISTGGSGRLFVDASGRVGVGTASPAAAVDAVAESTNGFGVRIRGRASDGFGALQFTSNDGISQTASLGVASSNTIVVSAGASERLRIDSSGRVGIGTSSPSARLTINNNSAAGVDGVLIGAQYNGTGEGLQINANTRTSADDATALLRVIDRTNSDALRVNVNGRVGIGTTTVSAKLHVAGATGGGVAGIWDTAAGGARIEYKDNGTRRGYLNWDTNSLILAADSGNSIKFSTNAGVTQHATIDSSGRLLVGTSSSVGGQGLQVVSGAGANHLGLYKFGNNDDGGELTFGTSRNGTIGSQTIVNNNDFLGRIFFRGSDGSAFIRGAEIACQVDGTPGSNDMPGRLVFSTTADGASSPTERMRINNAGDILFISSSNKAGIDAGTVDGKYFSSTGARLISSRSATTAAAHQIFINGNGQVGSITTDGSATSYVTSSDYRLKENIISVADGIVRLKQLKPSRFNFIADPTKTVDGFIAHEVQDVVPEAITGEKDAVDEDGNPIYQGIDQSKLVPLLTAALQEAIGEIESLKARVAALESA